MKESFEPGLLGKQLDAHFHQLLPGAREADDLAAIHIDRAETAGCEGERLFRADVNGFDFKQDIRCGLGDALAEVGCLALVHRRGIS